MQIKRKLKELNIIIPIFIGIIIPCFLYFYFSVPKDSRNPLPQPTSISNQPLPNSELLEIKNNTDFSEKVRNGKALLIFLTPNCPACKKDVELISKTYPKYLPK